ncbi:MULTISPECIES: S8 family serine peptidase [unclassified Microbacterium]|uniref:S8 family peptidase n=1 Tax=unclassified Microbacterium TaxID=2609290 RepID=UPI00214AB38E|nr:MULTISPECIES: S8 family serine peptidase [unclassified Microbacterium]MCR2784681.1 S8 family serine peptidase [Microbacterium sp. zg.B96]WIM16223.1 S8 family serine peptidase [Microbacterium sp. zg-B96]
MRRTTRLAAVALTAALVAIGPSGTAAATTQATLWWWDTYGIGAFHEQGWTGEGVRIAIMDDQINPDLPAFEGRSLTVADGTLCEETDSAVSAEATFGANHGTTLTASLIGTGAGGVRGIAPDAEVTFYGLGRTDEVGSCTSRERPDVLSPFGVALQHAIDDGAQIFTTSVGSPTESEEGDGAVIAEAIAKGMVIVHATPNPDQTMLASASLPLINGVLAASAVDSTGELQTDKNGQPYVLDYTHVVAAGVSLPTLGSVGGTWDEGGTASGSSFAAPLVAGMLALAAQRYPDATGNQLLQSLIHSTNGSIHEPTYDPATGYGYGAAWPASLLEDDPTDYPDENPLMDRPNGIPSAEQVAEAVARESGSSPSADPAPVPTDEAGVAAPGGTDPLGPIGLTVAVVLAVAVAAGVIAVIVFTARRKRLHQGGTP